MTVKEFAEKLKAYQEFQIIYHIRPDGDCIGSSFALALALKSLGKKCAVTGEYPVPEIHKSMTDKIPADYLQDSVYIAVDSCSPDRIGSYQNKKFTFCIDHHRNNSILAEYKYIEEDCGACSEIILKIIKALGVAVTKEMADLLYTALVTDTMCFRTSDTNQQSFETAAELAKYGAAIYEIGRKNMFVKSPQRMKIENILRNSFHFTCDNQILTGMITLDNLKEADILDSALEGINSLVDQVEGVKIGVTVRELPDGTTRCSMRTNGDIYANEICEALGGGGHSHAAACILNTDVYSAREKIEQHCAKWLKNQ